MKVTNISVKAQCAAGWARESKFTDAVRAMIRHSRGCIDRSHEIDPDRMTLSEFLDAIDDQRISFTLFAPSGEDGKPSREIGCLGDRYNEAKIWEEEA